MPISAEQFAAATHLILPQQYRKETSGNVHLRYEAVRRQRLESAGRIVRATGGVVSEFVVDTAAGAALVSVERHSRHRAELLRLLAEDIEESGGDLVVRPTRWTAHPDLDGPFPDVRAQIRASWSSGVSLSDAADDHCLREPQRGALHALMAHWTMQAQQSLVVMPTGTGKTEVMIAALILKRPQRLLVLVPSDLLRKQVADKFCSLGVLRQIGVVADRVRAPMVAVPAATPTDQDLDSLARANVVVTTVAMLARLADDRLRRLLSLFDLVMIDEAHHAPAASWNRIVEATRDISTTAFTATPFRNDGTRISGRTIYQYPLARAQERGYFRPIRFAAVDEIDSALGDERIAEVAIERLREDRANGNPHVLLARAGNIERAQSLFNDYYQQMAADLNPVVIHSRTQNKRQIFEAIRSGNHGVVVCVDMFGEGIDIPALKVAAMHDMYRSLAITLQFVGRFTRAAAQMGAATLVANLADDRVGAAVEDLYAEDADWNALIPELSARAIEGHQDLEAFIDQMRPELGRDAEVDLGLLKPKTSTVIYRTDRFNPFRVKHALSDNQDLRKIWVSRDRQMCIFITRTQGGIQWASVKAIADVIWDLTICRFDGQAGLLFTNGSQSGTTHRALAKEVGGDRARLISGEQMFRAFAGFERLVFHNVGLTSRGKTRFKMFTGLDVSEAVDPVQQTHSTKSNIFAVGYDQGQRRTIGVSQKGKVWSMSSSNVPTWSRWCDGVAAKITNEALAADDYLRHTLIPEEVNALPAREIFCVLQPDDWLHDTDGSLRFIAGGRSFNRVQVQMGQWTRRDNGTLAVSMEFGDQEAQIDLRWNAGGFSAVQTGGVPVSIRHGEKEDPLSAHLQEAPPVILFNDGSELIGNRLLRQHSELPMMFDVADIQRFDWTGIDITVESKWRHGQQRQRSVQGAVIEDCRTRNPAFIYDDDDKGEIADVVEISLQRNLAMVRLFHCKFSERERPGVRVADLYVVCGQAVRSVRVVGDPEELLKRLEMRQLEAHRGGRATRFECGTLSELRRLRKNARKFKFSFEIIVVQPGLARDRLDPATSSVLASADLYVRQFTGKPLLIYGS